MKRSITVNGAPLTRQDFYNTIPEFGIMPFWFVNGGMEYEEMAWQLAEYKRKGIPGIFFHARFGVLDTIGYLTDDWFERVRFTVEQAEKLGLQIWIYDEYNWPSGTAGQQLMKQYPNLTQRYLEMVEGDVPGQLFVFMEGTDSRYTDLEQSEPVYCCAILKKDLENKNFEYVDLMPNLAFNKVITWESPEGPWRTCYFIERQASWYADVLNPETTRRFIDMVHARYLSAMGGNLADKLHGFYTDEPAMHYFEVARNNFIIPWSADMFGIFSERRGYDLKPQLPKLFYDFGGDTHKVRYDFWSCLSDQYEECYYKAISDWCHSNGTLFTGHLLFEEVLRLHARTGGNLFHMLKYMDIVGVDHLYPRVGTRDMMDEHVALKLASSAAHQFGSTRLLCESMGGAYWDCTMTRMKWIADWEYVLGVNIFNPHGFHYSIEGERKRDWPPSMFYQHTWWSEYKRFNDYLSRAGYLLTGGRHVARLAILYPINSIWAHYQPQFEDNISALIGREFSWLTDRLLRLHIDFDYIDEDVLNECAFKDGALCVLKERYECVLLPAVTHIKLQTLNTLERFVASGGRVIADALLPIAFVDSDEDPSARVQALFGEHGAARYKMYSAGEQMSHSAIQSTGDGGRARVTADFARGNCERALRDIVCACVVSDILIDSPEVFSLHRVKDGVDFYFIVNPTRARIALTIKLRGERAPEWWDIMTGDIAPEYVYRFEDGYTVLQKTIEPIGSLMLGATQWQGETHIERADMLVTGIAEGEIHGYSKEPAQVIDIGGEYAFSHATPNALVIQNWLAYVNDAGLPFGAFEDEAFDQNMLAFRMGAWEMQLPAERKHKIYPAQIVFKAYFNAEYVPDDLKLMIDGFKCEKYELYVNGARVTRVAERGYLDAEIGEIAIADLARAGKNTIQIHMTVNERNAGLMDNIKLIGNFKLNERDALIKPAPKIELGDWAQKGYPYLSAMAAYETRAALDGIQGKRVLLRADVGEDMFTLNVNGRDMGACLWEPYALDISSAVREGDNALTIRVANTLTNLLRGERRRSGLFKCVLEIYDEIWEKIDK